ncbi:MAG: multiubiquitin domain-containing protein [Chloroflexi bacterium]|nr:multiubiquitin domain-containing protein [Chloroflexota bacterium]
METLEREVAHGAHVVTITVNEQPVKITGPKATGRQIKQAAIDQEVKIELSFVLSEEMPNRRTQIVGDNDEVTVHPGSKFVAVAPDDNS